MTRRTRGREIPLAVLLGVSSMLVGACGVGPQRAPVALGPDELPAGLRADAQATTTSVAVTADVDVWLVRDGRMVRVRHEVEPPVTADVAVTELLAGPDDAEQARQLRSAIPDAEVVEGVVVSRGIASVAIGPGFTDIPASDQVLAVAQLVLTLTDLRGVGRVAFTVADTAIAVPLPNGESTDQAVSRDDYLELVESVP